MHISQRESQPHIDLARIIVGVKYCFRYNARNRAIARGETGEPIDLEAIPRPHRRRREKKLMTMDEVNERFPLTKYKTWMATRASEGLPTAGGVAVAPSRAASIRDVDGAMPSSPVSTKHPVEDRPTTATSIKNTTEDTTTSAAIPATAVVKRSTDGTAFAPAVEHYAPLNQVHTRATDKDDEEDDEEDHIHDALPPELLSTPGDTCAICIDTIEDDDEIRGLTCGHAFHAGCLDPWLTSRRACCPLCKADYYVSKPRPEGEAAEADRPRRTGRMNMPQPPGSAWMGMRGAPRLIFPGRFMSSPMYPGDGYGVAQAGERRAARRARRANMEQSQSLEPPPVPAPDSPAGSATPGIGARFRSANPFSTRWMSAMRVPGRGTRTTGQAATVPPAAQLEEVVVR